MSLRTAKKKAAKSRVVIRKVAKKKVFKRKAGATTKPPSSAKPAPRRRPRRATSTQGFVQSPEGVYVPASAVPPVPTSKLTDGIGKASKDLRRLVRGLMQAIGSDLTIREIELAISFNAEGKFLGIGVGGAATVTLKLAPQDVD